MNEKTRAQIEAMKNQTIGVEVEMNNITREKAAKKAAEFFGTRRYEYTAGRNGYYTWSAWDAQGREWKFQRDVSIEGPDSEKCEMVTPVLTYGDIEFRLFQFADPANGKRNGLHAGELKAYIQLCLAMSQLAKQLRSASCKPQQTENEKYAFRCWMLRLGFIGEEFATAREILLRNMDGNASWRNGRQ